MSRFRCGVWNRLYDRYFHGRVTNAPFAYIQLVLSLGIKTKVAQNVSGSRLMDSVPGPGPIYWPGLHMAYYVGQHFSKQDWARYVAEETSPVEQRQSKKLANQVIVITTENRFLSFWLQLSRLRRRSTIGNNRILLPHLAIRQKLERKLDKCNVLRIWVSIFSFVRNLSYPE